MIRRCVDPTFTDWHLYGGRPGNPVTVCDRWYNYEAFVEDMPPRPSARHTIDRIDGNKGYYPGNVRWATATQQARNSAKNRMIEYNGETLPLSEWAERYGLNQTTLYARLGKGGKRGMSFHDAITTPLGIPTTKKGRINSASKMLTFNGETMPMVAWAERLGVPYKNLKSRILRGVDVATAFTQPYTRGGKKLGSFKSSTRMITFKGETRTIAGWAAHLGLSYSALRSRILRGMNPALALIRPFRDSPKRGH